MSNEFQKIAKLIIISTVVIILAIAWTGSFLISDFTQTKKEVTKLKDKYEKSVVAFGNGWEIRLDYKEDYHSNCDELKEAFEAIYGSIQARDEKENQGN